MKILKIVIIVVAILAIVGNFLPQDYTVTRELVIKAPLNSIHEHVANMEGWDRWTDWNQAEPPADSRRPQMESGVGSGKYFTGTSESGWFVITGNSVVDGFEYAIYSDNGDQATAIVSFFDLGGETKVSWTVKGSVNNPPILAPYIAFSKDFVLGSVLSQNLQNLKKALTQ